MDDNKSSCCNMINCGCDHKSQHSQTETINARTLIKKMESDQAVVVVNVLNSEAYDDCRIMSSINAPLNLLESIASGWDKNQDIVLYCASYHCLASKSAYKILKSMGFRRIAVYEGGIKEWRELGLPVDGASI